MTSCVSRIQNIQTYHIILKLQGECKIDPAYRCKFFHLDGRLELRRDNGELY